MLLENISVFNPSGVLLITADESNVGKTVFLQQILVECILPEEFRGRNADVIFLDTKTNLKMSQLELMLQSQIRKETLSMPEVQIEATSKRILSKLMLYRVYGLEQLAQAKIKLESLLEVRKATATPTVVILDSLSTFYWAYCATLERTTRLLFMKRILLAFSEVCGRHSTPFATSGIIEQNIPMDNKKFVERIHLERKSIRSLNFFRAHFSQGGKNTKIRKYGIRDTGPYWLK